MIRDLLLICVLALSSCSEAHSSGPHRLDPRPGDEERIAGGALPILILKDGEPCPDALFLSAPFFDLSGAFTARGLVETGVRESALTAAEPGVLRADDRGIVWWKPDPDHWFWWLRASDGERSAATYQNRGLLSDVWSAARGGYVVIELELYAQRDWPVRVTGIGETPSENVPIFLGTEEDMRVLTRLEWQPDGSVRGFDPDLIPGGDSTSYFIWAGLDRSQAEYWLGPRTQAISFDLAACGSMEIELFDADGVSVREPRAVFVDDADQESHWMQPFSAANSPSVVAHAGRAVMHGVPTGKRWRVGAALLPEAVMVATEVDGPTQPGERIRVRLSAAETSVPLQGKLIRPDGEVESSAVMAVRSSSTSVRFQTASDGSFRVLVPRLLLEGGKHLQIEGWPGWSEPQRLRALTPDEILACTADTQWNLSEEPFFAFGRMVDEQGRPVAFTDLMDAEGLNVDTKTDASGRFRLLPVEEYLLARLEHGRLEFGIYSPWHLDQQVMLQSGQRDALITLTTGARIMGQIARGQPLRNTEIQILRRGATEFANDSGAHNWFGPQGAFEIGPVPVDAIEVRIDCGVDGVAVLKDLQLEAGKVFKLPKPVRPAKIQPAK